MVIRRLPSGALQVRFQHRHVAYTATYPTRELAEDAEPLLRAAALTGRPDLSVARRPEAAAANSPRTDPPDLPGPPTPEEVRSSSSAGPANPMDTIFADVIPERPGPRAHEPDDVLTTGQAAALLGVTRPTLVAWLEAGRIPSHRCGSHRRVHRSDVLAYRKQDR